MMVWDGKKFRQVSEEKGKSLIDKGLAQDMRTTGGMDLLPEEHFQKVRMARKGDDIVDRQSPIPSVGEYKTRMMAAEGTKDGNR